MNNLLTPTFWDQEWARFRAENAGRKNKKPQNEYWNTRAQDFARSTIESPANRDRTTQVFRFLNCFDIFQPGISILDIGCGPGSFSIPLAGMGCRVTALDPAQKMLEILERNIPSGLPGEIEFVEALWEDFDIVERGWEEKFDLVFASMCPGIHSCKDIEKMILCSKKWCYISAFSGSRKYPLHDEVFSRLFNKSYINRFNDIIFPFNLVYSMGYKPSITFINTSSNITRQVADFKNELLEIIEGITSITPQIEAVIESVITEHAKNGLLEQQVLSAVGMMAWNKKLLG